MVILIDLEHLSNKLLSIVQNTKNLIDNGYYSDSPKLIHKYNRSSITEAINKCRCFPVIAELKFSTPITNLLNKPTLDTAKNKLIDYAESSICGISILTEPDYFSGSLEYLDYATATINYKIPILMKDFIIDSQQIDCAKKFGASSILLISSILTDNLQQKLIDYATNQNLEVLLEVNNKEEFSKALDSSVTLIGINNRNLRTMEVLIETTENLLKFRDKKEKKILSLSGINNSNDVLRVKKAGADGVLVGSNLMASSNVTSLINKFTHVQDVQ